MTSPNEPGRYMRTPQAANYIGLSPSSLEKDRTDGRLNIPHIKLGKAVVYDRDLLDKWLSEHARVPSTAHSPKAA
jgi:hypothetical protein